MERALASSLQRFPEITSYEDVVAGRFGDIDLSALLIYLIDTVDASALPFLARQFDVDGLKGYGLATTEAQRRQVIAEAIDLVRLRGTVAGIKRGLEAIGYPNSGVQERPGLLYNGEFVADGTRVYGGGNWATFAVWVNNGLATPTPGQIDLIRQMVEIYKNARSVLVQLIYAASLYDEANNIIPNVFVVGEFTYSTGSEPVVILLDEAANDGATIDDATYANAVFASYDEGDVVCPCNVYKAGTLYAFVNTDQSPNVITGTAFEIQAIPPASFDADQAVTITLTSTGQTFPINCVLIEPN
jgi:hypothetical protein